MTKGAVVLLGSGLVCFLGVLQATQDVPSVLKGSYLGQALPG